MTHFDAYLMVDWSGSSSPKGGKDSIWVGLVVREDARLLVLQPENPRTRASAVIRVRDLLCSLADRDLRVLVGFDFPYGYPRGFAAALGSPGDAKPWRVTWNRFSAGIRDGDKNENNRFEFASELNAKMDTSPGPFWACPRTRQTETLHSKGGSTTYRASLRTMPLRRETECRLPGTQEVWKLGGAGSVGSQALVGIPRVASLRGAPRLAAISLVWPFETGFTERPAPERGPFVLHAEIWPSVVPIDRTLHAVRDAAQVLTLARHFAALDDRGELGALFQAPRGLDAADLEACLDEEGWILGCMREV